GRLRRRAVVGGGAPARRATADPGDAGRGGGRDRHPRQPRRRLADARRPRPRPQPARRLPAPDRGCRGLAGRGAGRPGHALAGLGVAGPGHRAAGRRGGRAERVRAAARCLQRGYGRGAGGARPGRRARMAAGAARRQRGAPRAHLVAGRGRDRDDRAPGAHRQRRPRRVPGPRPPRAGRAFRHQPPHAAGGVRRRLPARPRRPRPARALTAILPGLTSGTGMPMIDTIHKDAQARMAKSIDALRHDLVKVRTGRASTALVEHIKVNYYGSDVPLSQVASVAVSDARSLTITPYEKQIVSAVEKAILGSDLGLTPNTAGTVIRLNLPALTEERRRELTKVVHAQGEDA